MVFLSADLKCMEIYAYRTLKGCNLTLKLDFLKIFSNDKKYAYCWAKYFKISDKKLPDFLKNCGCYNKDAKKFIEKLNDILFSLDEDCIVTRKIWGKFHKIITIVTPVAVVDFILEYFAKSKPKIMGIDCEAGFIDGKQKITVLQLATTDWLCLIDIGMLADKYSDNQWKTFFEHIFHPDIIRVGFSFSSDYNYICNRFPFLQSMLHEKERNVLCLQKLMNQNRFNNEFNSIFKKDIATNCGLATLAKEVLGITMNKKLQSTNWEKRPLTDDQKIYAVADALAALLIYERIETLLKQKFGNVKAMEKACYLQKK
uniref:3'-5' exonuclease domain-containing protein n=1 Tax=Panagrolaimus superbus TaxID=310955 RepID=A0A914YRL5_9BILA